MSLKYPAAIIQRGAEPVRTDLLILTQRNPRWSSLAKELPVWPPIKGSFERATLARVNPYECATVPKRTETKSPVLHVLLVVNL